ncbi:hypothetical protein AMAG_03420 [Allomyces macrogynus ATCC 38327]|uniref:Uncharacterized protein n=1 Tax=Allomyces macrogynus (strain ATCC 38327) TaxID=578462 RepID=A0A0L0S923_ALLM3|nr:hypothetical protein AMAG_03420 [Allomyces macrogynus ATCC 38327]|eukprot:KNE59073.1 hypothetical protein AMAG_03420 [Allomyces macrogynus ATCC 38327]
MHPDPDPATLIRLPILDRTDNPPRATPASAPVRPASPLSPRLARPVAPRVHDDAPPRVPPAIEAPIADLHPAVDPPSIAHPIHDHDHVPVHAPAAAMSPQVPRAAMPLAPVMRRTLDLRENKAPWTAKVAACAILVLFVVLVARIIAARRRAMQSTGWAARTAAEASAQEPLVAPEPAPATADAVSDSTTSPTSRPRTTSLPSSTTAASSVSSSSSTTHLSTSRASSATPTRRRSASPAPPARTHVLVDGRPTHRLVAAKRDSGFDDAAEPTPAAAACDWVPVEDRMHASMHSDTASTSSLNGSWALCRSLADVTLAPTVPAECTADLPTASFVAREMDDGAEMGALAAAALVEAAASVCEPDPAVSDFDEEKEDGRVL